MNHYLFSSCCTAFVCWLKLESTKCAVVPFLKHQIFLVAVFYTFNRADWLRIRSHMLCGLPVHFNTR